MNPISNVKSYLPLCLVILFGLLIIGVAFILFRDVDSQNTLEAPSHRSADVYQERRDAAEPSSEQCQDEPLSPTSKGPDIEDLSSYSLMEQREHLHATLLSSTIQGKIRDEEGNPIQDATIAIQSAFPDKIQTIIPLGDYSKSTNSNSSGSFRVAVPKEGAFSIRIVKEGFVPYLVSFALPDDDLEITLDKGIILSGVVKVAGTDSVLKEAKVRITDRVFSSLGSTDEKGVFTFQDLSQGRVHLDVFCENYDLKRLSSIFVQEEKENFIEVELNEGAPLCGIVLDHRTEEPIHNARVVYVIGFKDSDEINEVFREEKKTDKQGLFFYDSVSRRGYRLQVTAPGYSTSICEPFALMDDPNTCMKIHLKKEGAVEGRIYDPEGNPASRSEVRVFLQDLWEKKEVKTRSDISGNFMLSPLAAGKLTLLASHASHAPVVKDDIFLEPGTTLQNVEIRLTPASSIRGTVKDMEEKPIKGARVVLDGMESILTKKFYVFPLAYTDHNGSFLFKNLPEGEYRISACYENQQSRPTEVVLIPHEDLELSLELRDGLALSGKVIDSFGDPVDDVLISAVALDRFKPEQNPRNIRKYIEKRLQKSGPDARRKLNSPSPWSWNQLVGRSLSRYRGSCRSREDGRFNLSGFLPEDSVILRFWRYGFNSKMVTDIIPSAEELVIELSPMCQVQGRVVDSSSFLPITSFLVSLTNVSQNKKKNTRLKKTTSNKRERLFRSMDGEFLLESVKPGDYELRIVAKGYQPNEPLRMTVSPDSVPPYQEIHLDLSGILKGKVMGMNKEPVSGLSVFLAAADAASVPSPKKKTKNSTKSKKETKKQKKNGKERKVINRTRTDKNGRFIFRDLKPSSYQILIGNPKHLVTDPKTVTVIRGESIASAFVLNDLASLNLSLEDHLGFSLVAEVTLTGGLGEMVCQGKTDSLGHLQFTNILHGKYKLKASAPGYESLKKSIHIDKKGKTEQTYRLEQKMAK